MATVKERYPGKWYLLYREGGKKKYLKLDKAHTSSEAKELLKKFEQAQTVKMFQDLGLIFPKDETHNDENQINFKDTVKSYMETDLLKKADKTQSNEISRLNTHWLPLFSSKNLSEISPSAVNQFDTQRSMAGISSTTRNHDLRVLRCVFKHAQNYLEWSGKIPIGKLPKQQKRRSNYLKLADVPVFLGGCDPVYLRAACLGIYNGLRLSEMLNLQKKDLDFETNTIRIRQGKSEERIVPMHPLNVQLLATLPEYYRQRLAIEKWYQELTGKQGQLRYVGRIRQQCRSQYVFPGREGGRRRTFQKAHERARELSGIQHITIHGLRHTYISLALRGGGDVSGVSKSAGHSNSRITTEIYDHLELEAHRTIVTNIKTHLPESVTKIVSGCYAGAENTDGPSEGAVSC